MCFWLFIQVYRQTRATSDAIPQITSCNDLPRTIASLPNDDKRHHILQEIYSSEWTYVNGLEIVVEVSVCVCVSVTVCMCVCVSVCVSVCVCVCAHISSHTVNVQVFKKPLKASLNATEVDCLFANVEE